MALSEKAGLLKRVHCQNAGEKFNGVLSAVALQ